MGTDEVNFSPSIAGDCVVAAVYLPERVRGLRDSKDTTPKQRAALFGQMAAAGAVYSVTHASVPDIALLGIYGARNRAALDALSGLQARLAAIAASGVARPKHYPQPVGTLIIHCDGHMQRNLAGAGYRGIYVAQVGAGRKDWRVAAASIIAKVYYDALMHGFGLAWSGYGFETDHGSLSRAHRQALRAKGPSPVHRWHGYAEAWWRNILGTGSS